MDQFIQYTPTEILFGENTQAEVGKEVKKWGGSRVFIVYGGGSVKKSGLLAQVEEALEKSAEFKEGHAEKIEKLENLRHKYDELLSKKNAVSSRLMKAFPDMKSKHHNDILQKLKKINIRK